MLDIRRGDCWNLFKSILLFVITCCFVLLARGASAQSPVDTIFITDIDSNNFPDISLTIRAFDTSNVLMTSIGNGDLAIYENGEPVENVTFSQGSSIPNYVYFMVDRNQYNTFSTFASDVVPNTLSALVNGGHFQDGVDAVGLISTDPSALNDATVVVEPTTSAETFLSKLSTLNYSKTTKANTLDSIRFALDELNSLAKVGQANVSVIYIGAGFDGDVQSALLSGALSLADDFNATGATFHALHTSEQLADPIQRLVNGTGGQYVVFQPDQDSSAAVQTLYETLIAQTVTVQANYRSSLGANGDRSVAAVPTGRSAAEVTQDASVSYEVAISPPLITISDPAPDQRFVREGVSLDGDGYEFNLQTIDVKAQLNWQDNLPRNIESAVLISNGVVVGEIQNLTDQEFNFSLDINDIGESTTLPISVEIRDELGIEASSEQRQLRVEVSLLSDTILTPQVKFVVTTETVETEVIKTPCEENPTGMECISTAYLPWLMGLGSLLTLVFVTIGFRRQLTNITQNAGTAVTSAVRQVRHTMLGGSVRGQKVIAKMKVLTARPDLINNEIDIYTHTTSFGRDPKLCDVQLYDEDDRSTVSGLHCTLQYESSKDVFYLTDDNSSAGTKINGRPIESNDPILLKDGDEIILGDLFRRGAKLQFLIADVAAAKEASNAFEDDGDMYDPFEPLPAVPISAPSITPASASETVLDHSIDEDGADYLDTYQPPSEDNIDIFDDRNYASNADNRFFDDIEETADEAVEETDETYGRTILDHEAMDEIEASEDYGRTILDHKAMDEVDDDETYGRTILDHEAMDDEDPFTTMAPPHGNAANATILDRGGNDFDFDYSDDEQNNTDNDDWLNDLD